MTLNNPTKMKKIITIMIATSIFLIGCSNYNVEKPNLAEEKRQHYEDKIIELLETISDKEVSNEDKIDKFRSLGISYERIGSYDQAIEYYMKVLEYIPTDFTSLNNLSAIYEEVGEIEAAAKNIVVLYQNNKGTQGVISDTIRIMVKNGDFQNAQFILNEYATDYQTEETRPYISEQFEYIQRMENKEQ